MARILHRTARRTYCRRNTILLGLVWTLGLCSGQAVYWMSETNYTSLMRSPSYSAVSIVCLLHAFFPFFLSAVAYFLHTPRMLLPLSFGKAFLSSYASAVVCMLYGTAGWLARWFLMFSDLCTMPILYFFWRRCLSDDRTVSVPEAFFLVALALLIASIDCSVISTLFLAFVIF